MDRVQKEKTEGYGKTVDLFKFANDVVTNQEAWGNPSILLAGIDTHSSAIVEAFFSTLDDKTKKERAGSLRVMVHKFLSSAIGC